MTSQPTTILKSILSLTLILLFFISAQASSDNYVSDSLEERIVLERDVTTKLKLFSELFHELNSKNPKRALNLATRQLYLSKAVKNQAFIAEANANMGIANYRLGNYDKALIQALSALRIRESMNDKSAIAASLIDIGSIYSIQKQYALALKYFQRALTLRQGLNNPKALASSFNSLGNVYQDMNNDSLALANYQRSFEIRKSIGDKIGTAQSLNNMAIVFSSQNKLHESLDYLFQSLAIKQEMNDLNGMAASYNNIGDVYVQLAAKSGKPADLDKAISYFNKSLSIAKELHLKEIIKVCAEALADAYHEKGDDAKAYAYFRTYSLMKDSLMNESIALSEAEMLSKYESEKKEKEINMLNQEKLIADSRSNYQRIIIFSGILFTIVSLGFLINRFRVKQRANTILTQKNKLIDQNRTELRKQKEIIEQKNRDLTDSIEYARNVQNLILPDEKELKKLFPESFVLFLPKSILSGDFYWYHVTEERVLLAAIDCTGHGIPGAMMSFLGYNLLENVVKEHGITSPGQLLRNLNNEIFNALSLKNENLNSKYGMDIALVSIHKGKREIRFSGAHHPLYLTRNGELLEYKGDKYSLGTLYTGPEKEFNEHQIFYQSGDRLFLFSDGFPDQIGGKDRKKFFYQPFKEAILSSSGMHPNAQKQELERILNDWKGNRDQTDDVLVIGVQL